MFRDLMIANQNEGRIGNQGQPQQRVVENPIADIVPVVANPLPEANPDIQADEERARQLQQEEDASIQEEDR